MLKWPRAMTLVAVALAVCAAAPAYGASVPVEAGSARAEVFAPSSECGCHANLVSQWSETMHAQALTDPIYKLKRDEANEATDGKLGAFCDTCHGPVATMSGEIGSATMSPASADAIGCSFCHHITGNAGAPANTSQLVATDGVRRAQLKDPQAPHPAAYSEFHESAELCGGCHNVDHPVNGMHLEATYSEWKKSSYAKEGIVCQECHMSEAPGVIGPTTGYAAAGGKQRDNIYQMSFVGGQVALGPAEIATARLQSAATIKVATPEIVAPGSEASVTVTVTNSGAGHYLPTGLTEVRQMWLEVYAEDAEGERAKIGERIFGTILQDDKGNAPVELWEATSIKSDDRIPPQESVTQDATFAMPDGAEQAKVTAVLYYKSVPDEMAAKAGTKNPTTEMAVGTSAVYASEAAKQAANKAAAEDPAEAPAPAGPRMLLLSVLAGLGVLLVAGISWLVAKRRK